MPFESKGTLQKFHMTNTPPEIYKYDNNNKYCCTKMAHFVQCEKIPKCYLPRTAEMTDF